MSQYATGPNRSNLTTVTLLDNQATPVTLISYPATNNNYRWLYYHIRRGSAYTIADVKMLTDGSTVVGGTNQNTIGTSGITISKTVSGGMVLLQYTSTNTGVNGTFSYSWLENS